MTMEFLWSCIIGLLPNFITLNGINYLFGLPRKMQELEIKIEELNSQEAEVNTKLRGEMEFQSGKKRKRESVECWFRNVERKKHEFRTIQAAAGESSFYNIVSCAKWKTRVEEMIGEVAELIQQGNFPEGLSLDVHETRGHALLTTGLIGQTFQRNFDNIWKCLMNDEVLIIGIHGMGGVGKTAVMKHIHNRMLENVDTFGNVSWVTVSPNFGISGLQNDIARKVGLNLSSEDAEMTRAAYLSEALARRNKSILILDDVWNHIHLERVGIPIGVNGFKLILTTRSLDVCRRMGCQLNIKVTPLSEEEAWNLFMEILGHDVALPPKVKEIAKCVANKCAGLPLGIVTMAASMRGVNDIRQWRNLLEELKEPTTEQGDSESEVALALKSSYSQLENKRLQLCFLHCALFPADSEIEEDRLINDFIVEGLMDRRKSRQAELDMGYTVLKKLENRCLLESSEPIPPLFRFVKMHDLIREVALQIVRASQSSMVKAGVQLSEIPVEQEWTADLEKVSLMNNKISKIPSGTSPRCPRLSTLMLQRNPLKRIPDSFFLNLPALRVLNLSDTLIEVLPNSTSDLENLTALLLRSCRELTYVPPLGKLRALLDLDLGCTGIKEVPQGMEGLFNLKCLYLDKTRYLKKLPTGILPRLLHLQVIKLRGSSKRVKVRGEELEGLKELEEFEGRLYNLHDFNRFVKSKCSEQLHVRHLEVGGHPYFPNAYGCVKQVRLWECSLKRGGGREEDQFLLPLDIQLLGIYKCRDMSNNLLDVFPSLDNARDLKRIEIRGCDKIECIVMLSLSDERESVQLQSLENLVLDNLRNFSALVNWEGVSSPPCGTFSSLKSLFLSDCPKIKKLFTGRLLLHLRALEVVSVRECDQMEEIIADEEEGMGASRIDPLSSSSHNVSPIILPKLRNLDLIALPELKSVCRGTMICDSIEQIMVSGCLKLRRLPFSPHGVDGQPYPPSSLKSIFIDVRNKEWWESVELNHLNAKSVLQPFVNFVQFFRRNRKKPFL